MANERDQAYKVIRTDGYALQDDGSEQHPYVRGAVRTPLGYVSVYSEGRHTALSIIHDGYEVARMFDRGFTKRGLVTLARRFIEEMQP